MIKRETMEKIGRVNARLARGERVKPSLKAEHIAQATWYSPRVKKLRHGRDVLAGKQPVLGDVVLDAVPKEPPRTYGELPAGLRREIERLRRESEKLGVELVKEMLSE